MYIIHDNIHNGAIVCTCYDGWKIQEISKKEAGRGRCMIKQSSYINVPVYVYKEVGSALYREKGAVEVANDVS